MQVRFTRTLLSHPRLPQSRKPANPHSPPAATYDGNMRVHGEDVKAQDKDVGGALLAALLCHRDEAVSAAGRQDEGGAAGRQLVRQRLPNAAGGTNEPHNLALEGIARHAGGGACSRHVGVAEPKGGGNKGEGGEEGTCHRQQNLKRGHLQAGAAAGRINAGMGDNCDCMRVVELVAVVSIAVC